MQKINTTYLNTSKMLYLLLFSFMSFSCFAKGGDQITEIISSIQTLDSSELTKGDESPEPNSFVTLDFSIYNGESWDGRDKSVNMKSQCINGDVITGFKFSNIKLETIPSSYFSEAIIYFSNSNQADDGIQLTVGSRNETSGISYFTSDGILDISDSGNIDIFATNNHEFIFQFYERIDDERDNIDAKFTQGLIHVHGINLSISDSCEFANQVLTTDISARFDEMSFNNLKIGDDLDIKFQITNEGSNAANNLIIENTLSPNLKFNELYCNNDPLINIDTPTLEITTLESNETINCTISAKVLAYGNLTVSVDVNSDNENNNLSNNSDIFSFNGPALIIPAYNNYTLTILFLLITMFSFIVFKKRHSSFNKN